MVDRGADVFALDEMLRKPLDLATSRDMKRLLRKAEEHQSAGKVWDLCDSECALLLTYFSSFSPKMNDLSHPLENGSPSHSPHPSLSRALGGWTPSRSLPPTLFWWPHPQAFPGLDAGGPLPSPRDPLRQSHHHQGFLVLLCVRKPIPIDSHLG